VEKTINAKAISIAEGNITLCRTRQPAKGLYEKVLLTNT
jgi:hypothetical protein